MRVVIIAFIALFFFFVQSEVYRRLWDKNLKVFISFSRSELSEGENGELIEVIENRKLFPLLALKVKFQTSRNLAFGDYAGSKTTDQFYRNEVFHIGGGEKITRKLSFKAQKRGYYEIKNIDLVGTDLFFSTEMMNSISSNCYLYVYPKTFYSEEFQISLQKLNGEILVKRHLLEDPFEYRGVREYQPNDDIKSVNWKATARTGALKVNQKNYTAMQSIRIFLNTEDTLILKREREVEASMQIAMSLTSHFLSQNMKVSFYTNGRDILTGEAFRISGGAGLGQLETISKALARIDTQKPTLSFCELFAEDILEKDDNVITIFVSPNGYDDFLELLQDCENKNITYTWFYPCNMSAQSDFPETIQKHMQLIHLQS